MTAPVQLRDRLSGATPAGLASFAAACATRMTPVFEYFALDGPDRHRAWVAELWTVARSPDAGRARELRRQVDTAPEASVVADPNVPGYYAMRSLGALFYAAGVLLDDDKPASAYACAAEASALLAEFDFLLQVPPGSPGSLESLEDRAEHEWLDRHADSLDVIDGDLATEAATSAVIERLAEAAPAVARVRGWDMTQWRPA